jgi:5,10-methylene-tetrahydrofolate dehydrogenase/methenyl tetrahydrofolate cyclohydrolase
MTDENVVMSQVIPRKDVDCLSPVGLKRHAGEWRILPATVRGIRSPLLYRSGRMNNGMGQPNGYKGGGGRSIAGRPLAAVLSTVGQR